MLITLQEQIAHVNRVVINLEKYVAGATYLLETCLQEGPFIHFLCGKRWPMW